MRPVLITSSIVLALVIGLRADDPTSRYVPLTSVASTLPPSSSGHRCLILRDVPIGERHVVRVKALLHSLAEHSAWPRVQNYVHKPLVSRPQSDR
jgi:hypothetical protein